MDRRNFVKYTAMGAVSMYINPFNIRSASHKLDLAYAGIQLYTVRQEMEADPVGTLSAIKAIGYSHVEGASYDKRRFYGQPKENFKRIVEDQGLKMFSNHISFGKPGNKDEYDMQNNWEQVCEDAAYMGQKYIVCPWLPQEVRNTIDDYKRTAQLLNKCGAQAKKYGLTLCYHNHAFEFTPIGKIQPFDILLNETESDLVKFELDIYWTHRAGVNTKKFIKKNKGRFPLFHVKDMENSSDKSFVEVGTGVIDWKKMFNLADIAGMEYFYIEQDDMKKYKPMESIKISFDNLKRIKL